MKRSTYPHELIGEQVTVVEAKNASNIGLSGKVVDETKSTLTIEVQGSTKMVFKRDIVLKIKDQLIKGIDLNKRPEDRLKG